MNTSSIKLLMTEGLMAAYVRDHSTTPEVVNISKVSSIFGFGKGGDRAAEWRVCIIIGRKNRRNTQ